MTDDRLYFLPIATPGSTSRGLVPLGGPGWFDSSWELERGLDVSEGWPRDASAVAWLETPRLDDQASCGGAGGGASLSAT